MQEILWFSRSTLNRGMKELIHVLPFIFARRCRILINPLDINIQK
jgi:hypothetical protein